MKMGHFGTNNTILATMIAQVSSSPGRSREPVQAGLRVGAAECDITPPVGYEIQHYYRHSIGVHDPLFTRCLYLEDDRGSSLVIISLDLIGAYYETCDELRSEIRREMGIDNALINASHPHSSAALGPRGHTDISNDTNSGWNDQTLDAILEIVRQAKEHAEPVSIRAGRAPAQVGFNRRVLNKDNGHIYMDVNREGPVVPWVNVLVADSKSTGKPLAVLFEHAAHPVIVPHTSKLISADYPGAAVKRIKEVLGNDVIALFGQGCAGNVNGFPLRSTHELADQAGQKLGDAVLVAVESSEPIKSTTFTVTSAQATLPSAPLPSEEEVEKMAQRNSEDSRRMDQLDVVRSFLEGDGKAPPKRFDAYAVMFGDEWCLVTMACEVFSQYELWIDENAPFKHKMTFAYTNGYEECGYIAVDEALRMGAKGGYEAARLPNWWGQVWGTHCGPPAVGVERIVKDKLASLWMQAGSKN
jgi:neutral ceramidase